MRRLLAPGAVFLSIVFVWAVGHAQTSSPVQGYQIVHVYPHDRDAFTQGLVYEAGYLYESTGRNGKSSVRKVDLPTGQVVERYDLPPEYFAEGLTTFDPNLIQLTWTSGNAFVYERSSFTIKRTFRYTGEGWGLTNDGRNLVMSDGSSSLRFLDPNTFGEVRRIAVRDDSGAQLKNLNELEFVRGEIYANLWHSDRIVRISPQTGKVLGWIDLSGLMDARKVGDNPDAVLNGIAYDRIEDRLFVTGKLWPNLFEIKLVPRAK